MYKPAIFYPQTMEEICDLLRGSTKQNYPDKRQGFLPFSCLMSESTFFLLCNQNLSAVVLVYKCGLWTGQTAMSSFPTSCPTKAEWRTILENELRTTFVKLRQTVVNTRNIFSIVTSTRASFANYAWHFLAQENRWIDCWSRFSLFLLLNWASGKILRQEIVLIILQR